MKNVMALVIVALSMAIVAGQAVADSTAATVNGSTAVVIHDEGIVTITVTRAIISGACVPEAYLKVRLHPNGPWMRQGKAKRSVKDNSYVFEWEWVTYPGFKDSIYDFHVDITCDYGTEDGIVVVDNSDIYDPGDHPFPRSSPPPKKDDDPGDGGTGSGPTGGGWTDTGGSTTGNAGGTGEVSTGTSGDGGTGGVGNSNGGTSGSTSGNSGSNGGRRNGYGRTSLASGTGSDDADVSIKGKDNGEVTPLSTVQDLGNGVLQLSVTRSFNGGGSGPPCDPTATMKVRLQPSGSWTDLGQGTRTGSNPYTWTWDWDTCTYQNGTYDTYSDITCNPSPPSPDIGTATVSNPKVTAIDGPDVVCLNTNAQFTATTDPAGQGSKVNWGGGETPPSATGTGTFTTKWSTPGEKTVTASCYCAGSGMNKTVYVVELTMTNPSGDPTLSEQAQDNVNEFWFNTANPGVCDIRCTANINPSNQYTTAWAEENVSWSISPGISGSQMSYVDVNGNPADNKGLDVTIRFTDLPVANSAFGDKTVTMTACSQEQSNPIQVFYFKLVDNHPGGQSGSPNWFYYWKQVYSLGDSFVFGGPSALGAIRFI